jgi:hypothetical protein
MVKNNSKTTAISLRSLARASIAAMAFVGIALVAGEAGARFDDWLFDDVGFQENPSYEALFFRDEARLRHGRPGARWKQVRLNNLGMRGADVPPEGLPGCRRLMFLGASETFGEPSASDQEFPARVAQQVEAGNCIHVLNTSFPGIAPQTLNMYYAATLHQYKPDIVYVYPSTHFYLAEPLPRKPVAPPNPEMIAPAAIPPHEDTRTLFEKSRLLERLRETAEIPAFVQQYLDHKRVVDLLAEGASGPQFESVPKERLELLAEDMRALVETIRRSGAEPVLMTHAVRATFPPRAEDFRDLAAMRVYVPRASEETLAEFEYSAAETMRSLAREMNVHLIDVAARLDGQRRMFIDLVHFAPEGHAEVARLIVADLQRK